jgi:hypothetical protein
MNDIRLIRKLSSAPAPCLGAAGRAAYTRRTPPLGSEWWTRGWAQSTSAIDRRCEQLATDLVNAYERVGSADTDALPFYRTRFGEGLPTELQQGILGVPDEFAQEGDLIVLKRFDDGGVARILVCGADDQVIGQVEPAQLFSVEYWLEWSAYWLFACLGASPEQLTRTLAARLP